MTKPIQERIFAV